MILSEIKTILERLQFPKRYISDQTAICIKALMDKSGRTGLLSGYKNLSDGARIHDILNFARDVIGKKVAENTRESYRKTSLAPLMNYGVIVRHQLSTNDPNTYYRLHPEYAVLFSEGDSKQRDELIKRLQIASVKSKERRTSRDRSAKDILAIVDNKLAFALSPGGHSLLEKAVIESFSHAFLVEPIVVYLGDTTPRKGYQNRSLMRKLNLQSILPQPCRT